VIYAGLIVVVAVFYPSGIVGWFKERTARRRARRDGASAEQARAAAQDASPLAAAPHESTGGTL
jgi:branched-chain amino acid transport system permease protein